MITIKHARIAISTGAPVIVITGAYGNQPATVLEILQRDEGWVVKGRDLVGEVIRRPEDLVPSPELLEAEEAGDYDSAGFLPGEKSPEQTRIYEAAEDLTELLRQVVPNTTIHWAVEEARSALRNLSKMSGTILTVDRQPVDEEEDDPRGYQGQMPAENQLLP
ncbi:hypothetical protein AB0I95_15115 [Micromonospora sp. NPDC049751]|uniref:hypothetical protein n=1 Tax=Micromonospora sp. NPDC049751 TaxID=3154837 RepID=UPI00340829F1